MKKNMNSKIDWTKLYILLYTYRAVQIFLKREKKKQITWFFKSALQFDGLLNSWISISLSVEEERKTVFFLSRHSQVTTILFVRNVGVLANLVGAMHLTYDKWHHERRVILHFLKIFHCYCYYHIYYSICFCLLNLSGMYVLRTYIILSVTIIFLFLNWGKN